MADDDDTPQDDAAAAAEWEAMLNEEGENQGDDAGSGDAENGATVDEDGVARDASGRILNQNEIDSLLGFDEIGDDSNSRKNDGIYAILDKSLMAYEKLPMMEVVFDRLVRQMSSSFRVLTSDNVDVGIDSMVSLRFDDYLNSIPLPALLVVFRAVEWENLGLVTVDSALIYSLVDILLGGRKSNTALRVEGRPYTTIEQEIVRQTVDIILADLSAAFEPLSPTSFQHERLETNPRFATITRPSNPALLVRLRVDMEDRGGIVEILFPHTTLEPIRDLLVQMFVGESAGHDPMWEKYLGKEVQMADVDLEVILNEKILSLGDIMRFKIGSTILLDCTPDDDVVIKSNGVTITRGKLGRVSENLAVSLDKPIIERMHAEK